MNFLVLIVGIRVPLPARWAVAGASRGSMSRQSGAVWAARQTPRGAEGLPEAPAPRLVGDLRRRGPRPGRSTSAGASPPASRGPGRAVRSRPRASVRPPRGGRAGRSRAGRRAASGRRRVGPAPESTGPCSSGASAPPAPLPGPGRAGGRRARQDLLQERRPGGLVGNLLRETAAEIAEVGGLLRRLPDEEARQRTDPGCQLLLDAAVDLGVPRRGCGEGVRDGGLERGAGRVLGGRRRARDGSGGGCRSVLPRPGGRRTRARPPRRSVGRRSLSRASSRRTAAQKPSESSGVNVRGSGARSFRWRDMMTALEEPGNGTCPVTSWKSVAPRE